MKHFPGSCLALLSMVFALTTELSGEVPLLPPPARSGGMSLADALNARKTVRSYQAKELSAQQLSNLLWAANGINRQDGKRTVPSAINRQEISIYVVTAGGGYFWDSAKNALEQRTAEDVRSGAGFFEAPLYLVLVADLDRAVNAHYADIDCGYVSQNIYLHCTAAGLGTCAIGSFNRPKNAENFDRMCRKLKLQQNEKVLLTHSVGIPR